MACTVLSTVYTVLYSVGEPAIIGQYPMFVQGMHKVDTIALNVLQLGVVC